MGKPDSSHVESFCTEYIGAESDTRGSETSQYPEEEKTKVIPSVVASERGIAQTILFEGWGCRTTM